MSNYCLKKIIQVLNGLVNKAHESGKSSFQISGLLHADSGKNRNSGLIEAVSKYRGQFELDQNADGKVDVGDAIAAISNCALVGLGKLFGK